LYKTRLGIWAYGLIEVRGVHKDVGLTDKYLLGAEMGSAILNFWAADFLGEVLTLLGWWFLTTTPMELQIKTLQDSSASFIFSNTF
jgi:hypothetical protein